LEAAPALQTPINSATKRRETTHRRGARPASRVERPDRDDREAARGEFERALAEVLDDDREIPSELATR
jgi:hypothetical protein